MAEILNAHGSLNDIFVVELTPGDFASETDLRAFVRSLCDRGGHGGRRRPRGRRLVSPEGGPRRLPFVAQEIHSAALAPWSQKRH